MAVRTECSRADVGGLKDPFGFCSTVRASVTLSPRVGALTYRVAVGVARWGHPDSMESTAMSRQCLKQDFEMQKS